MFTARYGLIPYIKQITFSLYNVKVLYGYNISIEELLPEEGHNRWPKHAADYADHNIINLHISICTSWMFMNIKMVFVCAELRFVTQTKNGLTFSGRTPYRTFLYTGTKMRVALIFLPLSHHLTRKHFLPCAPPNNKYLRQRFHAYVR